MAVAGFYGRILPSPAAIKLNSLEGKLFSHFPLFHVSGSRKSNTGKVEKTHQTEEERRRGKERKTQEEEKMALAGLYRRVLPSPAIGFDSSEGKVFSRLPHLPNISPHLHYLSHF